MSSSNTAQLLRQPLLSRSDLDSIKALPRTERDAFIGSLSRAEFNTLEQAAYYWRWIARPEQIAPDGDWFIWLCQAGRGWGKTRTGAEYIRERIDAGTARVANVAAPTWTDVMDTMVQGTDAAPGLMGVWPEYQKPELRMAKDDPHLRCHNGAKIRLRSAQQADRFRGPQADVGWVDEVASWKPEKMSQTEAFSLFELGIRLGPAPRIVVTTTPKRHGIVGELAKREDCHTTRGTLYDNRANLSPTFVAMVERRYKGTRLGRQEILGELLDDVEGAVITHAELESLRWEGLPEIQRIVVGVDPNISSGEDADACGISVSGKGADGELYSIADRTIQAGPAGWARRVVDLYHEHSADKVVAEVNNGGEMVAQVIRNVDSRVPVKMVRASRGKHVRAEPVLALFEQGRAHTGPGQEALEDQLAAFTLDGYDGDGSPDRADAFVWAAHELMLGGGVGWGDLYGSEAA